MHAYNGKCAAEEHKQVPSGERNEHIGHDKESTLCLGGVKEVHTV